MNLKIFSVLTALFIAALNSSGQTTDSFSITAIPHKLFWENKPLSFSSTANSIRIEAGAKTDMFRDPNVTYNTRQCTQIAV